MDQWRDLVDFDVPVVTSAEAASTIGPRLFGYDEAAGTAWKAPGRSAVGVGRLSSRSVRGHDCAVRGVRGSAVHD